MKIHGLYLPIPKFCELCVCVAQFSSVASLCPTLCDPTEWSTAGCLSFTISQSLLKLMSIESVMPSNHLILCCPLLLLLSIFPSIRIFSNESALIRWPNIGASASVSVLPMNIQGWFPLELTGLITLQGTLKSVLQHQSLKASVFGTQPYDPTIISIHD